MVNYGEVEKKKSVFLGGKVYKGLLRMTLRKNRPSPRTSVVLCKGVVFYLCDLKIDLEWKSGDPVFPAIGRSVVSNMIGSR